jgi:hypothetical protein
MELVNNYYGNTMFPLGTSRVKFDVRIFNPKQSGNKYSVLISTQFKTARISKQSAEKNYL